MEFHEFITLIGRKRKTIFGIMVLFVLIAVGVVAVQKFKYSSSSQVLVVQEYAGNTDAYTASKSSEHLSNVLATVIRSNSFFTKVMTSSPSINSAYFGDNSRDQMKEWTKTVSARSINDTGIIAINVYHPDRTESAKIAGAVNYVLMTQHSAYDGAGEAVKIRLIDQPVTSILPVKPNIPLTFGLALILGFMTGLIYIYLLPENYSRQKQESLSFEHILQAHIPHLQQVQQNQRNSYSHQHQPTYNVRGQSPEEVLAKINNYPDPVPIKHQAPTVTPLGFRATVSLDQSEQPLMYSPEELNDPNIIVRQGSMRNILG